MSDQNELEVSTPYLPPEELPYADHDAVLAEAKQTNKHCEQ
jgi:hypothetical protein